MLARRREKTYSPLCIYWVNPYIDISRFFWIGFPGTEEGKMSTPSPTLLSAASQNGNSLLINHSAKVPKKQAYHQKNAFRPNESLVWKSWYHNGNWMSDNLETFRCVKMDARDVEFWKADLSCSYLALVCQHGPGQHGQHGQLSSH